MSSGIRTFDDLLDRCRVDEITGCWNWAGATTASGSPSMWVPAIGGVGSLGTLLSILTTGERPKKGVCWTPICRNPLCARSDPKHRRQTNFSTLQKITRPTLTPLHRARIARGRRRVSRYYTPELAHEIRTGSETLQAIADRTGMDMTMVSRIRRGESWAPVSPWSMP